LFRAGWNPAKAGKTKDNACFSVPIYRRAEPKVGRNQHPPLHEVQGFLKNCAKNLALHEFKKGNKD